LTAGDYVDGLAGTDTMTVTFAGNVTIPATTIKNVETITLSDTAGGTFNMLLVENNPAVNWTNTIDGTTSTVTNAPIGSTYGLSGKGDLTVTYASVTGSADEAKLSLTGTGTSATNESTINVSTTNAIEDISIATTGTNYVILTGGTGADNITITGAGTNRIDVGSSGSVASNVAVNASTATGANTIEMGTTLSLGDTITGGTGSDTIVADLTTAAQILPTLSSIETLEVDFSAAATFNGLYTTGLETLTITDVGAAQTATSIPATVTTINLGKGTAVNGTNNASLTYATGAASDVTVNVGATATASNPAFDSGDLTIAGNTGALTIQSSGDAANLIDAVAVNSAGSVTIKGSTQALTTTTVSATGAATFAVDSSLKATTVTNVTLDESTSAINLTSGTGALSVGNITQTAGVASNDIASNVTIAASGTTTLSVGTIEFDGGASGSITANVTATNDSTGAMTITGITYDHDVTAAGDTASGTVTLAANSGDITLSTLTMDAATDTYEVNVNLVLSAASGKTLAITDLAHVNGADMGTVTVSGAGTINVDTNDTNTTPIESNTVINSTATGTFNMNIASATGNITASLGDVTSSGSNTLTTGSGTDTITGGSGADTISTGGGNDVITAGGGADSITGGGGNDTINLTESTAASDTIVFEATATANGQDTITGFASGDIINVSAFATDNAATATLADTTTGNQAIADNDIFNVTDADGSIGTTVANVAALFGGGGKVFEAIAATEEIVVAVQDTTNNVTNIFYVDNDGDTTVANSEVVLVATINGYTTALADANIAD